MIDPNNIINYNRTEKELQELLLFLICVAGKNAQTTSRLLENFLTIRSGGALNILSPFNKIRWMIGELIIPRYEGMCGFDFLKERLIGCRLGQYNKLDKSFRQLAASDFNLKTCSLEDLMTIHGIGRKSASCFLMWTRENQYLSALDVHLLRYLRELKDDFNNNPELQNVYMPSDSKCGQIKSLLNSVDIPKATPSSKRVYDILENAVLICADLEKKTPEEFDLEIWRRYSKNE